MLPTSHNIKLIVAYDGTHYLGWQKTHTGPSIEETLNRVLEQILQEKISLQAASRTDAGVHAQGQVINFFSSKQSLDLNLLKHSLNSLLPKDIVIVETSQAQTSFHPTLDSSGKEYHYHVCYGSVQLPQQRFYSWHYPYPLDFDKIRLAIPLFIGVHDFSAFCNVKKNSSYEHYIREITSIHILESSDNIVMIKICGNSFLYKMVRNIVGTLIYVGSGKIQLEEIPNILQSRDRTLAGVTAPANGLTLFKVFY